MSKPEQPKKRRSRRKNIYQVEEIRPGQKGIHAWDGDAWLEEKWEREKKYLERGELPRHWFW